MGGIEGKVIYDTKENNDNNNNLSIENGIVIDDFPQPEEGYDEKKLNENKSNCGKEIDSIIRPELEKTNGEYNPNSVVDPSMINPRPNTNNNHGNNHNSNIKSRVNIGGRIYNGQGGYSDGNGVNLGGIKIK